jgi:hypothetical protein
MTPPGMTLPAWRAHLRQALAELDVLECLLQAFPEPSAARRRKRTEACATLRAYFIEALEEAQDG